MKNKNSNSEKISETHISGINRVVKLDIVVNGKSISHFKHFRLQQSAKTHHSFELILAHDSLGKIQNHNLEQAQQFLGKRITIVFKYKDLENESPERTFVGIVTKVAFSQEKMSLGNIVLKGQSPTILMDSAPHTQSFGGNQSVNTSIIADNIIKETLGTTQFNFRIETQNKSYINYSSQYCETHYNYLSRIAEAYGEQFYYDGEILHFGKLPPSEKPVKLVYGSNVTDVQVELKAVHTKPEYFGYSSSNHAKMLGSDNSIKHLGDLSSKAYELNDTIFKTRSLTPTPVNANMFLDVDDSQKSARGSKAVEVFTVSGNTTVPFLYIGCVADIEMRKPDSNETSYFTKLMMTEVSHEVNARGYYTGSFEAIAEGTGFMPKPDFMTPKAEPQVATVISNIDPLNQGRIQVQFDWQLNDTTHFIRMMSPDAGGTGAITQNRGFVAVPEIGDQVMVGFEYHNPDFPFAMGGMFHGGNALGGLVDNHLRSIQTKSGIKVLMNDAERSVTIEDPSGNIYFMDGEGNINVTAPQNINFTAGNNMDINVGNNLTFTVGNTTLMTVLQKILINSPIMLQMITELFHTQAGKALINSENEIKIEAPETNVSGTKKLFMHSDESTIVNSKGIVDMHGKQGNNQTNNPLNYEIASFEITAKCIVYFRPKKDWKGLGYGFDYMRRGDTSLINGGTADFGDIDYETIISKQYTDATFATLVTDGNYYKGSFKKDSAKYAALKSEYNVHIIPWKAKKDSSGTDLKDSAGKIIPDEYFCSWLAIYPPFPTPVPFDDSLDGAKIPPPFRPNTTAVISIIVEIEEEPDFLRFEDNEYFTITPKEINVKGKGKGKHAFADNITIECLREFSSDQTLVINSIKKNTAGIEEKLPAGKLKVWANDSSKQKNKKVVFVQVKTSSTASTKDASSEKDRINNYIRQALIELDPNSDIITLEVFDATHSFAPFMNGSSVKDSDGSQDLHDFLKAKLQSKFGNKYDSHFKAFYINETGDGGLLGYSQYNADYVVVFGGANNQTASHEFLHSFTLPHTFDNSGKYTYEYAKTENLLDYSHHATGHWNDRCALWYWQWKEANK
ncbi:type VI secretion system Vgr family protein [Chryseobacterium sp. 18068]|uniref:type VI secretion system Vgr family protein n=1 Tax=Chryseobacterium sp. 18068 TaxID=2681414 RepID=UPI00135AC6FF|nr:phage baseplate assembly protein V [Chryseobacterium sp. 18068]